MFKHVQQRRWHKPCCSSCDSLPDPSPPAKQCITEQRHAAGAIARRWQPRQSHRHGSESCSPSSFRPPHGSRPWPTGAWSCLHTARECACTASCSSCPAGWPCTCAGRRCTASLGRTRAAAGADAAAPQLRYGQALLRLAAAVLDLTSLDGASFSKQQQNFAPHDATPRPAASVVAEPPHEYV